MPTNKGGTYTISWRFFLATATPLLLITALLTSFIIQTRQEDSFNNFLKTGDLTTRYLGDIAMLDLWSGNKQSLQTVSDNLERFPDLKGIVFLNADLQSIVATNGFQLPKDFNPLNNKEYLHSGELLIFQKPVFLTGIEISDYSGMLATGHDEPEILGWIVTAYDLSGNLLQREYILFTSMSIGLMVLLFSVLLSIYFGRGIIKPIHSLTLTVQAMGAGDLDIRAEDTNIEEFFQLASGLNRLAEAVSLSTQDLEDRVLMATGQLQLSLNNLREKHSELTAVKETAVEALKAKSEFLARMSHELRTPITAIQGFTRLLQETELGDAEKNYCGIINESSAQLLNLINDILSLSRMESKSFKIEAIPFNIIETLEYAVGQASLAAREKKLELILGIAPEVPTTVVGDHFRISQIVINLVTNAIKFTTAGYVQVSVNATQRNDQIVDIEIAVKDTGIGIPQHQQENLFQAFTQADTSTTRKHGGSGLGLAIVKNLVDVMNGAIQLKSSEEQGTAISITLPLPFTAVESSLPLIDIKAIIIDEHPLSSQALTDTLCRFVSEVVVFSEHVDIQRQSPDLIILSLSNAEDDENHMQKIGQLIKSINTPVLVLTGSRKLEKNFPEHIYNSSSLRFLCKPATQLSLHHSISQLLSKQVDFSALAAPQSNVLQGLSILIAEDNPFTREFLKTFLTREKATCMAVSNGIEAINTCRNESFDLILLDIHMPGKNGIDTVKEIRAMDNRNKDTPVIAITADITQKNKQVLSGAGINDLLFKPVDEQELLDAILSFCRPKQASHELQSRLGDEIPIELFTEEINRLYTLTLSAFENDNLDEIRDPIHQLQGVAGVFKLHALEEAVQQTHSAVKSANHTDIKNALTCLKQEIKNLENSTTL